MKLTKYLARSISLLLLVLAISGCPKGSDPYTSSMQASLEVSDAVAQAIPIIQQLQTSGELTAPEAHQVYGYLNTVTVGNGVFRNAARSLHSSGNTSAASYIAAASTFIQGVDSPTALAAIHITNPESQKKVMLYLQAVDTVLNAIQTVIQNNTTTPVAAPTPVTASRNGGLKWTPSLSQI